MQSLHSAQHTKALNSLLCPWYAYSFSGAEGRVEGQLLQRCYHCLPSAFSGAIPDTQGAASFQCVQAWWGQCGQSPGAAMSKHGFWKQPYKERCRCGGLIPSLGRRTLWSAPILSPELPNWMEALVAMVMAGSTAHLVLAFPWSYFTPQSEFPGM